MAVGYRFHPGMLSMTDASLAQSKSTPMRPALAWALVAWALARLPLALLALYLVRHSLLDLIERFFDVVGITLFVIDRASTLASRLLLALVAGTAFLAAAKLGQRLEGWKGFAASVACVGAVAIAAATYAGGGWKLVAIVPALVASNWAALNLLARAGVTRERLNLLIAIPPGLGEALLASRYLNWLRQTASGAGSPMHVEQPAKWPGAMLAAVALAMLVPGSKLVAIETALRSSPDVRMFAEGDFNGLALDAATRTLFATGHGLKRVVAFNADDLSAPPRTVDVDTGFAQSLEYNAAHGELFVYNEPIRSIQIFDAKTLMHKVTISAPVSPGDSWIVFEPIFGAIVVSSEADRKGGIPLLVVNRDTGAVMDRRPEEAGTIMGHPSEPIVYINFFRHGAAVLAYDVSKKAIVARTPADARLDRMAFDVKTNELLVASPVESRIQRFDAATLAPKGAYPSIFGVRTLAIDHTNDALIVGSLATGKVALMSLLDRKIRRSWYVGPWLRHIVLAPERGVAFISSIGGLYELRYARHP
jgi:hypothetical protein